MTRKLKYSLWGFVIFLILAASVYIYMRQTDDLIFDEQVAFSPSKECENIIIKLIEHSDKIDIVVFDINNDNIVAALKQAEKKGKKIRILTDKRQAASKSSKVLDLYEAGINIRDWLYVLDHCKAIDLIYHTGKAGETYNVGGRNERNNLEIVHKICAILDEKRPRKSGKYADLITFVKDRAGHDKRYAIDATKLETELGWKAEETFETGIVKTVEWYLR